jgi:CRISPR system Cascade subunit CasD
MASTPILVLRLDGVLQSWGEHSKWDYRDSASMPTKSGIIGLLGCAIGLERNDPGLQRLSQQLKIAIRADKAGVELSDFHTVSSRHLLNAKGKLRGNIGEYSRLVTNRIYLQDAFFTVAITGEAEVLEHLANALQRPKWPIYLGRKSCVPSRPVYDGITTEYSGLQEAIRELEWYGEGPCLIEMEDLGDSGIQIERQDVNAGERRFHSRVVVRKTIERRTHEDVSQ